MEVQEQAKKPTTIRGLTLSNIQGICDVYEKDTFTTAELFEEVAKDRPKTNLHTLQTTVSKDIVGNGFVVKVGKTNPVLWKITEEGRKADPFNFPSYDTARRREKKLYAGKKLAVVPEPATAPKIESPDGPVTQKERFDFVEATFELIQHLKKQVGLWQIKCQDTERIKNGEINDLRQEIKGKTKTIEELNQKVISLRGQIRRSFSNTDLKDEVNKWKRSGQHTNP